MVTVPQLYSELRIGGEADEIPTDTSNILMRILNYSNLRIEKFAPGAPEDVKDRAVIMLCAWIFESNPLGPTPDSSFRKSGAYDCVWPWRTHGLGVISRDDDV